MARNYRALNLRMQAIWHHRSQKQIGTAIGVTGFRVSQILRSKHIADDLFETMLPATGGTPPKVVLADGSLHGLETLEQATDLTLEELTAIEEAAQEAARLTRAGLIEAVRISRPVPPHGYPEPDRLALLRRRAGVLLERLKGLDAPEARSVVVQVDEEYQSWALCEAVCDESVRQASRDLESAAAWARLAREIAELVHGPEGWRKRLLGYAMAHEANVLRVQGELQAAEALLAEAKLLWLAGSDSQGVLDRGRILDLEASLGRDQRRFGEALDRLEEALAVGRSRARVLIKKGFTLEVMGSYERAVETLLEAVPLVSLQDDPRLWYNLHFNLSVNFTHLGRYGEGTRLAERVREVAATLGDDIFLTRVTWLQGRLAAGLGQSGEALRYLKEARQRFASRGMSYDVALALLEEAVLLLVEGRTAEVKALARELGEVFKAKGVEREALAALRLFHEAMERGEATTELARRVLRYLFRARYDQDLPFNAS